jgi:hypothetical protein
LWSTSASGIVGQLTLATASAAVGPVKSGVNKTGPPCVPSASMVADREYRRFGMVGPITEA